MPTKSRQLLFQPLTVVDLPFQVLENAFWRPQAAKLHGDHRDSLASISSAAGEKTYQKLRAAWALEETWINHALNALLASVPDGALARLMGGLCGGIPLDAPQLVRLDAGGIASTTGAPDFVLLGEQTCILGECKVDAQPSSARYDFQQFTKYQMLGAILACARAPAIKRQPVHLLVAPELDPATFCRDHQQWRPRLDDHRLVVDPSTMEMRDRKARFRDFEAWRSFVRKTLLEDRVLRRCDLDPAEVERLTAADSPVLVPTYVVTWTELMAAVRALAEPAGLRNLARAATKLDALAYGPFGPRIDKFVTKVAIWSAPTK